MELANDASCNAPTFVHKKCAQVASCNALTFVHKKALRIRVPIAPRGRQRPRPALCRCGELVSSWLDFLMVDGSLD